MKKAKGKAAVWVVEGKFSENADFSSFGFATSFRPRAVGKLKECRGRFTGVEFRIARYVREEGK